VDRGIACLTLRLILALVRFLIFEGAAMRAAFHKFILSAVSFGFAACGGVLPARAADLGLMTSGPAAIGNCSEIVFVCENGRQYPLYPIAVSEVVSPRCIRTAAAACTFG
jgi:hypothetical protein